MKIQIRQSVDEALKVLSDVQRNVLILRYGLDGKNPRTLQEVATAYSLTRERIRQIQVTALSHLREKSECVALLASSVERIEEMLSICGGGADRDTLCHACEIAEVQEQGYVSLLLDVGALFKVSPETPSIEKYWFADPEGKRVLDALLESVHERFGSETASPVADSVMREFFARKEAEYGRKLRYDRVLRLSKIIRSNPCNEWGHKKHPQISLSSVAGYIYLVLRKEEQPLHFTTIANKVGELRGSPYHIGGCHNELVRNEDFVLVGRGLYALREQGYRPGTIRDVIIEALKENGPMTREEVVKYVCDRRQVREQSVLLTLCRKDLFSRDEGGRYVCVPVVAE